MTLNEYAPKLIKFIGYRLNVKTIQGTENDIKFCSGILETVQCSMLERLGTLTIIYTDREEKPIKEVRYFFDEVAEISTVGGRVLWKLDEKTFIGKGVRASEFNSNVNDNLFVSDTLMKAIDSIQNRFKRVFPIRVQDTNLCETKKKPLTFPISNITYESDKEGPYLCLNVSLDNFKGFLFKTNQNPPEEEYADEQ